MALDIYDSQYLLILAPSLVIALMFLFFWLFMKETSYDEVLAKRLKVMDASAIALARDNNLPLMVFPLDEPGGFRGILAGEGTYTRVGG